MPLLAVELLEFCCITVYKQKR